MIYFVRHGETIANEQNFFAGLLDVPLTDLGKRQAEKAGHLLSETGIAFDEVHVSTLSRAKTTASIMMDIAGITGVEVREFKELVERDFGCFARQNKNLLRRVCGYHSFSEKLHSPSDKPESGEAMNLMFARLSNYYNRILKPLADSGRNILVVAHKYVIELIAMIVAGKDTTEYFDLRLPNSKPMTDSELQGYFKSESKLMKEISDWTIFSSTKLIFCGAITGGIGKLLYATEIDPMLFMGLLGMCLAVSSFFVLLSVNRQVIRQSLSVGDIPYSSWLVRVLVALVVLISLGSLSEHPSFILLLMPPALIVPMLSMLLGGDLYVAIRKTMLISACSPLLIALIVILMGGDLSTLIPFLVIFTGAMIVPGFLAQGARALDPIKAGKFAERYKWTSVLAVVLLATLCTYVYTPANLLELLNGISDESGSFFSQGFELSMVYLVMKLFAMYCPKKGIGWKVRTDLYLAHGTPNIFLWISIVSALGTASFAPFWGIVLFFSGIFIDELIFVSIFRKRFAAQTASLTAPAEEPAEIAVTEAIDVDDLVTV